jgi:hypothetical protein
MTYQPNYNPNPVYSYSTETQAVPIQTNYGQPYGLEPNLYATSPSVGAGDFQQAPPTDYKPQIEGKFDRVRIFSYGFPLSQDSRELTLKYCDPVRQTATTGIPCGQLSLL